MRGRRVSIAFSHPGSFPVVRPDSEHSRSRRKVLSKVQRVDRFRHWLAARFTCDRSAARAFGVDQKTVRNWQNGVTAPRYADGVQAMLLDPGAIPYLTGARDEL